MRMTSNHSFSNIECLLFSRKLCKNRRNEKVFFGSFFSSIPLLFDDFLVVNVSREVFKVLEIALMLSIELCENIFVNLKFMMKFMISQYLNLFLFS